MDRQSRRRSRGELLELRHRRSTPMIVAVVHEPCPACGLPIPVTITSDLDASGRGVTITLIPDMTDLWAHAWTHDGEAQADG